MERLDRVFANVQWLDLFPNSKILHLPKTHSDHSPLLINLNSCRKPRGPRPFRLGKFWINHPSFKDVVKSCWIDNNLIQATNQLRDSSLSWSRTTFGDTKKRLLSRINGIQCSAAYPYSSFLQNFESSLVKEYNTTLKLEEDFWKIHSRINWLNDGDANTKFYHISVINRRRTNRISYFKDNVENWITDHVLISSHAFNYFATCFTTDHNSSPRTSLISTPTNCFYPYLDSLDRPLCDHEIYTALFSLKPFKAPGPGGIHPYFYQNHWNMVGNSVLDCCHTIFTSLIIPEPLNNTYLCLIHKLRMLTFCRISGLLDYVTLCIKW